MIGVGLEVRVEVHALMEDPHDLEGGLSNSVEDDVVFVAMAPVPRPQFVTASTQLWRVYEPLQCAVELIEVVIGLHGSPCFEGVEPDVFEVEFGLGVIEGVMNDRRHAHGRGP